MPEEKPTTPPPARPTQPAPSAQPAQSQPPTGSAPPPKKKSNVVLIVVIILIVLLVLGGGGTYLAIYLAGRAVKSTVSDLASAVASISPSTTSPTAGGTTTEDPYKAAQDQTPTTGLAKQVNDEVKPILTTALGDLKLESYTDITETGAGLKYVTKKAIAQTDYQSIENAFTSQGYSKQYGGVESNGYTLSVTKGNLVILVGTFSDEPQRVNVTATKTE